METKAEVGRMKDGMMDAILSIFNLFVFKGKWPKPFADKRYRMTSWHQFVLDALVSMAED